MDKIDHIAIQTDSIEKSINWYKMMSTVKLSLRTVHGH